MDSHQAAYWLDRTPAEAADFLARTATASRRIGGFVKRADPAGPGWRDVLNDAGANPHVQNALIGAGVGGLGGLGVGLLGRRKKNPLATALTGAALGGLGAGAGSYLYHNSPTQFLHDSPEKATAAQQEQQNEATAYTKATPVEKILARTGIRPVPTVPDHDVAGPPTPLEAAQAKDRWSDLTVGATGQGVKGMAQGLFGHDVPTVAATGTTAGLIGAGDLAIRDQLQRFQEARRAAQAFNLGATGYDNPGRGVTAAVDTLRKDVLAANRPDPRPVVGRLMTAMQQARVGRGLLNRQAGGGVLASPVADILNAGYPRLPEPTPSRFGRIAGTGASLGAQVLGNMAAHRAADWYYGR